MVLTDSQFHDLDQEMMLANIHQRRYIYDSLIKEVQKDQAEKCAKAIDEFGDEHLIGDELNLAIKLIEVCRNAVEEENDK